MEFFFSKKLKKIKKNIIFFEKEQNSVEGGTAKLFFKKILFSINAVKIDINSISNHNNSLN